jgi:hypothetical protein
MHHIPGIPTSQIEIEWIFSIVGILMALCKCHLQIGNLDKLVFVNKNWPSYHGLVVSNPPTLHVACDVESNLIIELEVEF